MTLVELFVSDVERSIGYYAALGFRVRRRWGDWAQLVRDESLLTLQGDAHGLVGPHYFTPHLAHRPRGIGVEVVIEVEDVDALWSNAEAQGIPIVKPLQERPWNARDFRVADPDGYFIRFTSPLAAEHLD
jgi:catechol 2,3-dioxygenase-like lactoylglutathione lyase family enzyme